MSETTKRKPSVKRKPSLGEPLNDREVQVLQGMCAAMTNLEIGAQLYLSEDTVKTHARNLFPKLGARNRVHAVVLAYRTGLVRCPCRKVAAA